MCKQLRWMQPAAAPLCCRPARNALVCTALHPPHRLCFPDTSLCPSFPFPHRKRAGSLLPSVGAAVGRRAAVAQHSSASAHGSPPLPGSAHWSLPVPPLHNHTSYYSEDYFVGKLNIFAGSLAPSALTAHSVTFIQDWKRLVILLLSGTLLLAYYCFSLQYRSKLDVRHRKMPAKALVCSQ